MKETLCSLEQLGYINESENKYYKTFQNADYKKVEVTIIKYKFHYTIEVYQFNNSFKITYETIEEIKFLEEFLKKCLWIS